MSEEKQKNEPQPTFDFSRVSRKWNQAFVASISKATRAQTAMLRPLPGDADEDATQRHYDRVEQAINDLEALMEEQAALIAQVLVDVPREWLIEGAPDGLDWGQTASLDWIQSGRYSEILEMVQSGEARRQAVQKAKN